MSSFCIFTRLS
uniref:Uncharacterized protein n=1 Tax=Rhizophora mucronata TaxID=61149 RepID=A0A2P2P1B6_RHIMU